MTSIKIDCSITEKFFKHLLGEGWEEKTFILQSYDDDHDRMATEALNAKALGKKYISPRTATLIGTWQENKRKAIILAEDGCCIAWTLQEFEGKRRDSPEYFRGIRVIGIDFDNPSIPLPVFPLAPHIVVESSPGKYHVYWKIEPGFDRGTFDRLMACIISKFGADSNAKDVCRVLRLPGFIHQKRDSRKAPEGERLTFLSNILSSQDIPAYSAEQMLKGFEVSDWEVLQQISKLPPVKKTSFRQILPSTTPQDLIDVVKALACISPDERETWLKMGMALASLQQEGARAIWDQWSEGSSKYDPVDQDMAWDSFRENRTRVETPEQRIGIGTLFRLARESGYKPSRRSKDTDNLEWRLDLTIGGAKEDRHPTESLNNFMLIFSNHQDFKGKLWLDTVRGTTMVDDQPLSESLIAEMAAWLGKNERISIRSPNLIERAVEAVAAQTPRDLIKEWLEALPPWDGEERLTHWLSDMAGAERTAIGMEASRGLIVAMVSRGFNPGCLVRNVLILIGPENSGKTSILKEIGGEWYGKLDVNLESKEAYMLIQGVWLSELAELDALKKSEESRLKAFITHTSDEWIPKYSNFPTSSPRRTVFCGTTNEKSFLKGQTGNTRFIPIQTGREIQHELFRSVRDQLFAEAIVFYRAHPLDWWKLTPVGEEEAIVSREERRIVNEYEEPLRDWLRMNRQGETCFEDIATCFLKLEKPADWARALQMQIGQALVAIGWERKKVRTGKETHWKWRKIIE